MLPTKREKQYLHKQKINHPVLKKLITKLNWYTITNYFPTHRAQASWRVVSARSGFLTESETAVTGAGAGVAASGRLRSSCSRIEEQREKAPSSSSMNPSPASQDCCRGRVHSVLPKVGCHGTAGGGWRLKPERCWAVRVEQALTPGRWEQGELTELWGFGWPTARAQVGEALARSFLSVLHMFVSPPIMVAAILMQA
jgi:hypothetical protein